MALTQSGGSIRGALSITLRSLAAAALLAAGAQAAPLSLSDWARTVWSSAESGDSAAAFRVFAELPERHAISSVTALRSSLNKRNEHIAKSLGDRNQRIEETRKELAQHVADNDLMAALRSAVELHALKDPRGEHDVILEPVESSLVKQAEVQAKKAESKGDWLTAQELFLRLHLLYEIDGRYRPDIERVSRRLTMLRLYAPQRLYEMRNQRRIREGEDALPPFNEIGQDWAPKLSDISRNMVIKALNTAQRAQVDGIGMEPMLADGLNALRTLATTTDLAKEFQGLANTGAVRKFLDVLDNQAANVAGRADRAGYFDLVQTLDTVMRTNSDSVKLPESVLLHEFANGAMQALDDFSSIIWPDELRQFERSTQGRFTGVGIQISLDDANQLLVVTPLEGTPAQRAGIKRGDIIRLVDGEATLGITLSQAVDRITGDPGSKVVLGIEREGHEGLIDFPIIREVIPIYSVKGWSRNGPHETDWDWFIDHDDSIGYVRITQFSEDTSREMLRAVRQMKKDGLNGLILDLRFNPGGLLSEAVNIANLFVDHGVIVSQHDAQGNERDSQHAQPGLAVLDNLPVVVIINGGSASASEIVAGCLQDYHKAIILGARSYGKGSVQNVYPLDRGIAALKLTTQYYKLPGGRLIHRRDGRTDWGIEPDVHVDMLPQQISNALTLRQDVDIMPDPNDEEAKDRPGPEKLLTDGIDPQLETALLLLQSQSIAKSSPTAMLDQAPPAGS